jgi:hypothetical protein
MVMQLSTSHIHCQDVIVHSPKPAAVTVDVAINVKQSFIHGKYFVSRTLHQLLET